MLRVLVVDSSRERASDVCAALALAGHQVTAVLSSALELSAQVLATKPDVIFIQADSPSRDTLEHLATMNRDCPRPVLLCAQDTDSRLIRRAVKAGVSSYVVDSVPVERLEARALGLEFGEGGGGHVVSEPSPEPFSTRRRSWR